jgi:beta-fructofuranosidase
VTARHAGALTLPRVLTLTSDGLHTAPAPELVGLRDPDRWVQRQVSLDRPLDLPGLGTSLDIELLVDLPPEGTLHLDVRASALTGEATRLTLSMADRSLSLDRTASDLAAHSAAPSMPAGAEPPVTTVPVPLHPTDPVHLRVILDGSLLEAFTAGRALTSRIYPSQDDAVGIRLSADPPIGTARLQVWTLRTPPSRSAAAHSESSSPATATPRDLAPTGPTQHQDR